MIAVAETQIMPDRKDETSHAGTIVLATLLISGLLVAVALSLGAVDASGWPDASEMVSRFALLIFVAAMVVEPAGRLIPTRATRAAARERSSLILAFAAALAVSLICLVSPVRFGGEPLAAPTVAYCLLTSVILVVMLFSAHPATERLLGAPAWRSMQRIATAYFWLAFALTAMERLIGPHRTDYWHGFALLLLVTALLVRFADTFVTHLRGGVAENAG